MSRIYMMIGVPGSGKTTFVRNFLFDNDGMAVSRDQVRFELVSEDEKYFSKEKLVFSTFIQRIQELIDDRVENIFIDATHISVNSRKKVLSKLNIPLGTEVNAVVVLASLEECLKRNEMREGRSKIPKTAICRMSEQLEIPTKDEGFDSIYFV